MCLFMCACKHVCAGAHVYMSTCKPGVNLGCHSSGVIHIGFKDGLTLLELTK